MATSRLVIHDAAPAAPLHARRLEWRRRAAEPRREPLRVLVDDLDGNRVATLDDADALVVLPLRPGTYQVTASRGRARKGYTLALAEDATFDLYLALPTH